MYYSQPSIPVELYIRDRLDKALKLFTGGVYLSDTARTQIFDYLQSKMEKLGCIVMWPRDTKLIELCCSLGVPKEKMMTKEVVLSRNYSISYSSDYNKYAPDHKYMGIPGFYYRHGVNTFHNI